MDTILCRVVQIKIKEVEERPQTSCRWKLSFERHNMYTESALITLIHFTNVHLSIIFTAALSWKLFQHCDRWSFREWNFFKLLRVLVTVIKVVRELLCQLSFNDEPCRLEKLSFLYCATTFLIAEKSGNTSTGYCDNYILNIVAVKVALIPSNR